MSCEEQFQKYKYSNMKIILIQLKERNRHVQVFFPKNVVYFIALSLLVHKLFTFYIRGVLK